MPNPPEISPARCLSPFSTVPQCRRPKMGTGAVGTVNSLIPPEGFVILMVGTPIGDVLGNAIGV